MSDVRQRLLEAKKDIEQKSGVQFSHEYLALADLISAFVAIKIDTQIQILKPIAQEIKPLVRSTGKPSDDFLYGKHN